MNIGRAETGIILFFVSTLAGITLCFVGLFQPYILMSSIMNLNIIYGFYCVVTFVSLMLFVSDRIGFLRRMNGDKFVSALLMVLGLHLVVASLFLAFLSRYFIESTIFLLIFGWAGLTFILGLLWLFYGFKIWRYDDYIQFDSEIDLESQAKYRDLFLRYAKLYQHPSEILERHIQKKMNEGKTRKQAIEELTEET